MNELTRGRSGRWLLMALALALLVALAIAIPITSASGDVVVGGVNVELDGGVLLLSSGPSGSDVWVKYYEHPTVGMDPNTATPDAEQAFEFSRCTITGTIGDDLLSITGSMNGEDERDIALVSNGFGVKDKRNCSASQGEVNFGQMITFALGDYFDSSYSIDVAEIDVEGKHGADLKWLTDTGGSGGQEFPDTSDNGPDSGPADNVIAYIVYSDGFRSVTLWPDGGSLESVAIEGGGDGAVDGVEGDYRYDLDVNQTLFHLQSSKNFDGNLACEEEVSASGEVSDGDAAETVTVTRLDNKGGDCDADDSIEYNLFIDGDGVTFDPNIGDRVDTNFLVRIDWAPYEDPFSPPHRQISLSGDLSDLQDVVACESLVQGTASNSADDPDPTDTITHPDGVLWCLAGQRQNLLSESTWPSAETPWQQIQWYHGGIDPRFI
jgi:hypothetical protein